MKRLFFILLAAFVMSASPRVAPAQPVMVDDFEDYSTGGLPTNWKFVSKDENVYPVQKTMDGNEKVTIEKESGDQFARAYTKNEALRISLLEGKQFDWSFDEHPRLRWAWRALHLPKGASETDDNDVGGAMYVTFNEKDWLGRPRSIKYTYSSTLPVGKTISFGNLKAVVVSSGKNGTGSWKTVTRNVVKDYRQLFGGKPPQAVSVTIWSDSDTTGDRAKVDFDDIKLLPPK
jgi:hypothetical protein